jgi:hypothetical protein
MRSWLLDFFEIINRFEKEPEDDYEAPDVKNGL